MTPGMNLYLWTDHLQPRHRALLEQLRGLGYGSVEVPVLHHEDEAAYASASAWFDELGLTRSTAAALGPEANPASPDASVRAAALESLTRMIGCTAALGARRLVGPLHSSLGVFTGVPPTADEWRWSVDTVRAAGECAAAAGVELAIEPLNRFECYLLNDQRRGAEYVRAVGLPNVGLLYDTFHAHIEEKDPAAALDDVYGELMHVHASENDRSTPGQGQVRWHETLSVLKRRGWDGVLMVEAFGMSLPALAAATRIWRPMFESPEQLARDAVRFLRDAWAEAGNVPDGSGIR
jgi:D-psicose/D-tagatose/L-ribulose 3-epimerase